MKESWHSKFTFEEIDKLRQTSFLEKEEINQTGKPFDR